MFDNINSPIGIAFTVLLGVWLMVGFVALLMMVGSLITAYLEGALDEDYDIPGVDYAALRSTEGGCDI